MAYITPPTSLGQQLGYMCKRKQCHVVDVSILKQRHRTVDNFRRHQCPPQKNTLGAAHPGTRPRGGGVGTALKCTLVGMPYDYCPWAQTLQLAQLSTAELPVSQDGGGGWQVARGTPLTGGNNQLSSLFCTKAHTSAVEDERRCYVPESHLLPGSKTK